MNTSQPLSQTIQQQAHTTKKSMFVSITVNATLSVMLIGIGFISHSQALIADGIHSLSDLFADFVILLTNHNSKKIADTKHPYGHYRYENIASFLLGGLLILIGFGMIYTAVLKFNVPHHTNTVHIAALFTAILTLIIKELLFRYLLHTAKRINSSLLIANAWHARSDAISSLIVFASILGSFVGIPLLDSIGALIVGLIICKVGWGFSIQAFHILSDAGASQEIICEMENILNNIPNVQGVHALRTRQSGDWLFVDVHLEVMANLSIMEGHHISTTAKEILMSKFPVIDMMIHIDPV